MAVKPTAKAVMIAQRMADRLKIRTAPLAFSESVDSDGHPVINIGALTIGSASAIIRVVPENTPTAKDIFGNASENPATPHIVQMATEANNAGGAGADVLTRQQLSNILVEVYASGCTVQWYEEANGAAPTVATLGDAAKLKATVSQDSYWPLAGQ